MGQRRSWRARVGWILLGWALVVVCVALPVWAATAGDVNQVAGWANVLALPITALGLVLVLMDRRGAHSTEDAAGVRSRPRMAPPLDRMIERPELGRRLVAALTTRDPGSAGHMAALAGAGGFGKTRLAIWACHQNEVDRRYPGGQLWVTLGQETQGADLAERINDLAVILGAQRPAISDPDTAGAELGRLLDERDPILLVIDDVWGESQLRPFRFGGHQCTRLITTRISDLLPADAARVGVEAMSADQARQLVSDGVAGLPPGLADRLVDLGGRWPVLLSLINGALRRRVSRGHRPEQAAKDVVDRLQVDGPATFDSARQRDRGRAVRSTLEASIALLSSGDAERYGDLAIFPEDVDIPLDVLALLWPGRHAGALSEDLLALGLVADYRLDPPGPRLILHDVVRGYLRTRQSAARRTDTHAKLIDAASALLPLETPRAWWLLPTEAAYLWRYLPVHLSQAGRADELVALVSDLRWVEAKTSRFGSVVTVEADLELAQDPLCHALRDGLRAAAHLLTPIEPATALGATLASRLEHVRGLAPIVDRYLATAPRPRLEPAWPLPDRPDPSRPAEAFIHNGGMTSCAFSPDGSLLATTSDDTTTRLWQMPDGAQRALLTGHTGGTRRCVFSPDGTLLATTSQDQTVRLWRMPDGAEHSVLTGHRGWVDGCAFSPDGTWLATTGADRTVRLWLVRTGRLHATLSGHTDAVVSCVFAPDGTWLASTSRDRTIRLWHIPDGRLLATLSGHTDEVNSCAVSPDGTLLATTGDDGTTRLWRMPDGTELEILERSNTWMLACAFSPDGSLLATASFDHTAHLWRMSNRAEPTSLIGHTNSVNGCAFSPDGGLLATIGTDAVRLWRTNDGGLRAVLAGDVSPLAYCAFSPDGTLLATASSDATVQLRRMPEGRQQALLSGHTSRIICCAFSPDGSLLATASYDRTVRLWRMPDGEEAGVLAGHSDGVAGCAFSPDGAILASTGKDRTVRLWRLADGREIARLTGHTDWGERCEFSPDGQLLATTSKDHTVRLWRMPDGAAHAVLTSHTDWVDGCAFSPDGSLLATASYDRTLRLWRIPDGAAHAIFTGHTDRVDGCAFSRDGQLLATTGYDRTIRIWDVASGRCLCALRVSAPLVAVAWHPDGTTLCAVGRSGSYVLRLLR